MSWSIQDMLEVRLREPDDFSKIVETLTRIGMPSKDRTLVQSCHILHKLGRYFIVHFKEMYMLDELESDFRDSDLRRRNTIALLLSDWGLLTPIKPIDQSLTVPFEDIMVIKHKNKHKWKLVPKYRIGKSYE